MKAEELRTIADGMMMSDHTRHLAERCGELRSVGGRNRGPRQAGRFTVSTQNRLSARPTMPQNSTVRGGLCRRSENGKLAGDGHSGRPALPIAKGSTFRTRTFRSRP
jgi:hypothetical protein